ncbi:SLBB domain-containing protein [Prevotella sp. P2-180]|uniref:SLBB domain-containing protein n=1 Tax=Prevotella sp. P2-180 TaxID=2024224 RepID=UPI000B978FF1|nr:SLBB domain-containing protein [Prevotella sp. P2-180]OYP60538.1 capsule biosynthesis protein [Prevotella sp. P2-180]
MKRLFIMISMIVAMAGNAIAQSMSDDQVISFVVKEQQKGTSQSQIVTKLMQQGVTIEQIRKVRQKVERQKKNQGLGTQDITGESNRLRENNTSTSNQNISPYRIKDGNYTRHTYDTNDQEYMLMQNELNDFMPDSTTMAEQAMYRRLADDQISNRNKVFGRDIFNNPRLNFEPNMNIATPQNYRLGPGDAVYVDIYGASQKTIESTITPDGTIVIEGYGPIELSGLTVNQANSKLKATLGARYKSSKVKLTVGQTKTISVNVMGEVMTPGTYTLSAFATVFHALYMAGGTNSIGTLRNIKVFRNNRQVTTVDIYDYILNGKMTGNIRLAEGDVIVVGPYDCLVSISGKVKRPMYYEMKQTESLASLMKYSGGFTGDAYKKSVRVVRKSGTQYSVFNVGEFDMSSFRMSDEDSVSVDSILPRYSNMVEVRGAVFRPGMYQMGGEVETVRTLIQQAEGVTEDAFTAHAVMHRLKPDRTLEVIQVDVDGIMNGRVADIPLKNEDVLYIPSKKELQEDLTLTIHGEVMYPGIYKYADNETLEDLVLQAGGLKETASLMKVDVARRIVDQRLTTSSDTIAHTFSFALKDGFVIDGEPGFVLKPYDEIYVRKSPGFYKQQNVYVEGEVLFAGTYTLSKKNERVSEIIKKAGGLSNMAYPQGARLERRLTNLERKRVAEIMKLQREQREDEIRSQAIKSGKSISDLKQLASTDNYEIPDFYPVGIELDKAIANPGSDADIVLREGDRLTVPVYNGTVKINGEVMYPNTVAYKEGKGINYYIDLAGGFSGKAKKSRTYIIYMNGDVAKAGHGVKVKPGCEIVVPQKSMSKMSTAESISLISGTASIAAMIATIANLLK